jgi:hypothetical protein
MFARLFRGLLDSEDLNDRSMINQFAGGALRPEVFAYDPENPITNLGQTFGRGPSPFSSSYTDFIQSNPAGQIAASQLGGIGEAVRSPEQLAQLGASMPGQGPKTVAANTSMPRPGGLDDEAVSRLMSRMVRAIF